MSFQINMSTFAPDWDINCIQPGANNWYKDFHLMKMGDGTIVPDARSFFKYHNLDRRQFFEYYEGVSNGIIYDEKTFYENTNDPLIYDFKTFYERLPLYCSVCSPITFPGLFMIVGNDSYYLSEDGSNWTAGTETISFNPNAGCATSNNLDTFIFGGYGKLLVYNLDEGFFELEYPNVDMLSITYDSVEQLFTVLTSNDNTGTYDLLFINKFGNASGTPFIDPGVTGFNPVSIHYDPTYNKFVTYIVNNGDDAIALFEASDPSSYTTYTIQDFQNYNQFVRTWESPETITDINGLTTEYYKPNDITVIYVEGGDTFSGQLTSTTPTWTFIIDGDNVNLSFNTSVFPNKWQLVDTVNSIVIAEKGISGGVFGVYTVLDTSYITAFEVTPTRYITRIYSGDFDTWYSEEYILPIKGQNRSWTYGALTDQTDNAFGILVGDKTIVTNTNRYLTSYSKLGSATAYTFLQIIWSNTQNKFITVGDDSISNGIVIGYNFDPGFNELITLANTIASIAKIEAY
jgi:hypothetical protein